MERILPSLTTVIVLVVLGAITLAILAWTFGGGLERRLLFFETRSVPVTPDRLGLASTPFLLPTPDGTVISGWRIHGSRPGTIMVFNGNGGTIGHRLDRARALHDRTGLEVVLWDYRGYGGSTGTPGEAALLADARLVRDAIDQWQPGAPVVYLGESLGSAVATGLAVQRPPDGLVLETPFTSIVDMARELYPFLPSGLVRNRLATIERIGQVRVPLLVLHGDRDELVPLAQGIAVYEAAPGPKQLVVIPGGRHTDIAFVGGARYWDPLLGFIAQVTGVPQAAGQR